jgi:hypothetical protein
VVIGTGSVSGTVYNDLNGNGVQNPGEPGLPGVTITLRNNANAVVATTTTDANGNYSFTNLPVGAYSVTETDPAGLVSTTPNTVAVNVTSGGTATANFGDRPATDTVAVPTMTQWGMILFVLLAGFLAVQHLRRQRIQR